MPVVACGVCSKEFYTKPYWIKLGKGKFCSSKCLYVSRRKGKMVACDICGKEAYKTQKQLTHSKSGKFFCSKSCQTRWRNTEFVGPNHANWRNGKYVYRSILSRNGVVKRCRLCGLNDVRLLAVHHIDNDHKNNGIGNLTWLCHNCHFLVHHSEEDRRRLMEALV